MRVVIVTESFPPDVNGVAHCALQTARHLVDRGHAPLVVAPAPAPGNKAAAALAPCPVVHVPSLPLPGYPQVRVALPSRRLAAALIQHQPDIVHLASPFVLGVRGMAAAARLGIPAVAVYQTDLAGYARTYMGAGEAAAWRRIRSVHSAADLTLVPSSASMNDLEAHGVPRLKLWARGVDTARFRPELRDEKLRRELAPNGEVIVGYVGRLAPEKHIELLSGVCGLAGVKVVIVGDGPSQPALAEALPGAVFLGRRGGDDLARIFASFDIFAHTGPFETFCQTVQEAMASGVPVVAPPPAVRWTWSTTAAPGSWCRRATPTPYGTPWAPWSPTRRCGPRTGPPDTRRSTAAPGRPSATSSSPTTRPCSRRGGRRWRYELLGERLR